MSTTPFLRFAVSDQADFNVGVIWTGENFTGAQMALTVFAQAAAGGATLLTADTGGGRIQIRSDGAGFDYVIPQAAVAAVPVGLQRVQQTITQNGSTQVLFTGTWSKVVGAAQPAGQTIEYDGYTAPITFGDSAPAIQLNTTGAPGDSAYKIWLANGGRGTQADFLAALQQPATDAAASLESTVAAAARDVFRRQVINASTTAVAGAFYLCDTSVAPFTLKAPPDPEVGDSFGAQDHTVSWGTHNLTINPNGHPMRNPQDGSTFTDNLVCDENGVALVFTFDGAAWSF